VAIPPGFGVLDLSWRVAEAAGWPGGAASARIDVYVLDVNDFGAYASDQLTFTARFTFFNLAHHNATDLQFHAKRSPFESDGSAAKVVVFDNTDRDSIGVVPPANSLVSIEFAVRWRATADPSRLQANCVNRAQVHEGQFVYTTFSGPGIYTVRLVPERKCLFEQADGCAYQSVTLNGANFDKYVASTGFFTLNPDWDIGNSDGSPALVAGINLPTANDTAFLVVRRFPSANGSLFDDNALVVSLAVERQGGPACPSATFAPAPPAPPAAVAAQAVPTGCSALLVVADAFCTASQCSTSCDRALCAINANSSCLLPSTRADAFQSACSRLLSCLAPPTTTAPTTPAPPTAPTQKFACVQADLDRCAQFRLRCFQIALREQPNNASAACSCQGSYASCLPQEAFPPCEQMKIDARQSCVADAACTVADCNTPAPFLVAGVTMMTSSSTPSPPGNAGTPTTGGATTSRVDSSSSSTTRGGAVASTTTAASALPAPPSTTAIAGATPATTAAACDVPNQCIAKCGATNIKFCSCERQECQPASETVLTAASARPRPRSILWSTVTLATVWRACCA